MSPVRRACLPAALTPLIAAQALGANDVPP